MAELGLSHLIEHYVEFKQDSTELLVGVIHFVLAIAFDDDVDKSRGLDLDGRIVSVVRQGIIVYLVMEEKSLLHGWLDKASDEGCGFLP